MTWLDSLFFAAGMAVVVISSFLMLAGLLLLALWTLAGADALLEWWRRRGAPAAARATLQVLPRRYFPNMPREPPRPPGLRATITDGEDA